MEEELNIQTNVVDFILNSTVRNDSYGTDQTASSFIFGSLDSELSYDQKRCFLVAVDGLHFRDNRGQDHVKADFKLIEEGIEQAISQEVRTNLVALCDFGLLNQLSDDPIRFAFTDSAGIRISNYLHLKEFYDGGGRAKLAHNLSYKRIIIPSIPSNAKGFVQLMKSMERRVYEEHTGQLLGFQDKVSHDYKSNTRLLYSFQSQYFVIDPALSFEVIPLGQNRVKVVAECYHFLAEDAFRAILVEVAETWPGESTSIIANEIGIGKTEEKSALSDADSLNAFEMKQHLWEKLNQHFNIDELKDLCYGLNIPYEDILGDTRSSKSRELVDYVFRHNLHKEFLDKCEKLRPRINWK